MNDVAFKVASKAYLSLLKRLLMKLWCENFFSHFLEAFR